MWPTDIICSWCGLRAQRVAGDRFLSSLQHTYRGWAIGGNGLRDVEWEVDSYWVNWKDSEGIVRGNQGGDPEFAWRNCKKPRNVSVTVVADPVAICTWFLPNTSSERDHLPACLVWPLMWTLPFVSEYEDSRICTYRHNYCFRIDMPSWALNAYSQTASVMEY